MVAMKCYEKGEKDQVEKYHQVLPLCQWRQDQAHCHTMDPNPRIVEDNMYYVGTTHRRTLYGSRYQAPFADAMTLCQMKGMRLLSFFKDDKIESAQIFKLVEHYSREILSAGKNILETI